VRAQADTATASSTRWSGAREPDTRLKQTEVPITVVRFDEPKLLNGSDQKGKWSGVGVCEILNTRTLHHRPTGTTLSRHTYGEKRSKARSPPASYATEEGKRVRKERPEGGEPRMKEEANARR